MDEMTLYESILGPYSGVVVLITAILVMAIAILSRRARRQEFILVGSLAVVMIGAWGIVHPRQTPLMNDAQTVQDMIGAGKPVLLEFQSPY